MAAIAGEPTDEVLCQQLARGEESALRTLVARHRHRIWGLLLRSTGNEADAEDLFQEVWIRVVRAAGDFDPRQRFAPWLYRIAVNLLRDAARRRKAMPIAPTGDGTLPEQADRRRGADEEVAAGQEARALHQAIASLPAGQRDVLLLRWIEGLGEREVAEAVGIPPGTVKSRLHHAMRNLRALLVRPGGEEAAG